MGCESEKFLKEITTILTKGTTPTSIGCAYVDSGINYVKSESITAARELDKSKFAYVDTLTHAKLKRSQINENDILFSMAGMFLGKIALVKREDVPANTNQAVAIIRVDSELAYYLYIYYWLSQEWLVKTINACASQSAQPNINLKQIGEIGILLPSLHIQKSIAATLSCLDDKIELNNKINANLEAQAQAIFKSWFVDFEPFQDGEFVDSELGRLPKGWKVGLLSELIAIKYGKDYKRLDNGQIPVFGSGGIMRYVDTALYNNESVLIPRKGTLNNVLYINEPFWTIDTMFYTKMRKPHIAIFIYFLIRMQNLASMNTGSAVPSMTTDILNKLSTIIPPDPILEEFNQLVTPLFETVYQNRLQCHSLSAIRDTLLPKLMSGEIEV